MRLNEKIDLKKIEIRDVRRGGGVPAGDPVAAGR
jgi:hypothetical protein